VFEEWWDILLSLYYKFTVKSAGERILKISQHLAKLVAKIKWHLFPDTVQFPSHHYISNIVLLVLFSILKSNLAKTLVQTGF